MKNNKLKCWNSVHFHSSLLHYLYTVLDGLVIYVKARALKGRATNSRPRPDNPKAKKFGNKGLAWLNIPGIVCLLAVVT